MSNPTSNYGFVLPTATDLVTDLPADFEVALQAVDTQMFTNANAATQKSTLTTKGDIYAATAASTPARLGVGTNNQVLTADSTTATGLKWAGVTSPPTGWTLLNTGGTTLTGAATVTVSGISANQLMILINGATSTTSATIRIRPNNSTAGNYLYYGIGNSIASSYIVGNYQPRNQTLTSIDVGTTSTVATTLVSGYCFIDCANQTGSKQFHGVGSGDTGTAAGVSFGQKWFGGIHNLGAAITSISINTDSGSFSAGTVFVYGAN
jgi:hypothetical protein